MKFFGSEKRSFASQTGVCKRLMDFPLGSSSLTLTIACCIDYLVQDRQRLRNDRSIKSRAIISPNRAKATTVSGRSNERLMPNIFGGSGVNRVFGDVGGVISDAFEVTRDKH